MNAVSLSMAFVMGFTLSLHCAGMCGPIMMVMPFRSFSGVRKVAAVAGYHLGRIYVYAFLAIALHSFSGLFEPKIQQVISISLGGLLLFAGLMTFFPSLQIKLSAPWSSWTRKQLGKWLARPGIVGMTIAGMLNGLLPCGLVYVALSASMATHDVWQAALFMYVFGMGTLPVLLAVTLFTGSKTMMGKLAFLRVGSAKKLVPVMMFVFGAIFLLRGMNLGIPYLSPKVVIENNQVTSECCHAKAKG